jgi:uncharacterized protein (DUF302 family)
MHALQNFRHIARLDGMSSSDDAQSGRLGWHKFRGPSEPPPDLTYVTVTPAVTGVGWPPDPAPNPHEDPMTPRICVAALALCLTSPALADDFFTVDVQADYDDVLFSVEQAITNRGLVIDHVSLVGEMLARTKADVGGSKDLFAAAHVFSFCSATISREVMEAKLTNVQFCPYGIHVYQPAEDGAPVSVGYREFTDPSMRPVNYLLQGIVAEATKLD